MNKFILSPFSNKKVFSADQNFLKSLKIGNDVNIIFFDKYVAVFKVEKCKVLNIHDKSILLSGIMKHEFDFDGNYIADNEISSKLKKSFRVLLINSFDNFIVEELNCQRELTRDLPDWMEFDDLKKLTIRFNEYSNKFNTNDAQ